MLKIENKTLSVLVGSAFIFWGCNDAQEVQNGSQMIVGQFVSVFDKKVNYRCANEQKPLSSSGEFRCPSFPISFYMDNVKLGEINSIHKDGYVFPQDIILSEDSNAIYSSNGSLNNE